MKFRFLCSFLLAGVASMISIQLHAQQLKLGANPYQLSKDALLELNSADQGLLMPRVTKAQLLSGGNLFSSVDGMFVFVDDATEKSLYLKKNGAWIKVADFSNITAGTGISITNGVIANTGVTSFNTRTGDILPAAGDYAAFYVPPGRKLTISAGTGITAATTLTQDLSADRTFTINADNTNALWNANKLQSRAVLDSLPGDGDVLKWNAARSMFLPGQTMAGGASYGNMTSTDPATADSPDPLYRMKIWRGPWGKVNSSGAVPLNTGPTGAFAWSILAFQYNSGSNQFTTQLYFDKNTLALKEWASVTQPLTDNPSNPWYKVVTTLGSNIFTNGGLMFANKTYDATTEVAQDANNLYWDATNKKMGIRNNAPSATLDINGSIAYSIRTVTSSTTLAEDDYTVLVSGNTTITLPTPSVANKGRVYIIKRIGSDTVTINGTIFDGAPLYIGASGDKYVLQSDGSRWYVIN